MKAPKRVVAAFCCALLLGACAVGPDYRRPEAATPTLFKEAPKGWKRAQPADGADRGPWWRIYSDRQLDKLASQVAISNENIKAYEAAFRQAQAVVREARSNLFPTVSAYPSITRARSSGNTATTRTVEFNGSWDLDLWGKVRRQIESDQSGAQASAAQLADLTLSAQAELAVDYLGLRYQDSLEKLLIDTVHAYERSLKITENQYAQGVVSRSDVITAQTQLETTRASAIAAGRARAQYEHAIALLVGKPPVELDIPKRELAKVIPDVPLLLPSELLERRPDVAEAERKVQQQSALIGVAVAALYPAVNLSGMAGYSGSGAVFSAANAVWSIAASGSQTLLDGGGLRAAVDAARAAHDQSIASYRQTVLTAFREVEDQLSNLRIYRQQAVAQGKAVRLARQAVQITLNEYQAGTVNYTAVVMAQATALSNEQAMLQIQFGQLSAVANLVKALGGGWNTSRLPDAESL